MSNFTGRAGADGIPGKDGRDGTPGGKQITYTHISKQKSIKYNDKQIKNLFKHFHKMQYQFAQT